MAELSVEEINNLIDKINKSELTLDKLLLKVRSGDISQSVFNTISSQVKGVTESVDGLGNVAQSTFQSLSSLFGSGINYDQINKVYKSAQNIIQEYSTKAFEANESVNNGLIEGASVISTLINPALTSSSKLFGDFGNMGMESGRKISGNMEQINDIASKFKISTAATTELIRLQENSANLETAFIKMSLSSGQALKGMTDGTIERSNEGMLSLAQRIDQIAQQTGMLPDKVQPLLVQFGSKIPGAFDSFSESADGSGAAMDSLVKMIKVADGIGMSHTDVLSKIEQSYQKYGNTVDKTLDNLVAYNTTVQELGIRQDTMLNFIDKSTQGMESMNDATESAITLMGSLGKIMRENNVSESGMSNIVSGMMQGAKNMDIGQASFINQASGGRGGLAGGFEIELLKQQGNLGEIVNRTMQAMEKIGVGTPTTLQDVQDNPALAGQLLQQREMIKQFGLAQNDQDAYRVLEAMKSGAQDELKSALDSMKNPQQQMLEAIEDGNKVANIANNTLLEISRNASKMANTISAGVGGAIQKGDLALSENFNNMNVPFAEGAIQAGSEGTMPITDIYGGTENASSYSQQNIMDIAILSKETLSMFSNTLNSAINSLIEISKPTGATTTQQNVTLDGVVNIQVDIKDGIKTVADASFAENIEKWQKDKNRGSFTGSSQ